MSRSTPIVFSYAVLAAVACFSTFHVCAEDVVTVSPPNSAGIRLARIPAGEFLRGFDTSNRQDQRFHIVHRYSNHQNFADESPAHRVDITRSFEIGITEVTVGQFRQFVQATGY